MFVEKFTKLEVTKEDYISKILKTNHVKVAANCKVDETGQISNVEGFFQIMKINLSIEVQTIFLILIVFYL